VEANADRTAARRLVEALIRYASKTAIPNHAETNKQKKLSPRGTTSARTVPRQPSGLARSP
jgi:hypothetical protein